MEKKNGEKNIPEIKNWEEYLQIKNKKKEDNKKDVQQEQEKEKKKEEKEVEKG